MQLAFTHAMVNVSDMERSVRFYRDALGLSLRLHSPAWSEFDTGTTTLVLHAAGPPRESDPLPEPPSGTCALGFRVADVQAVHAELVRRSVRFVMPPTHRPGEGLRLAVALDPDGLAITFAQPG